MLIGELRFTIMATREALSVHYWVAARGMCACGYHKETGSFADLIDDWAKHVMDMVAVRVIWQLPDQPEPKE